MIFGKYINRYYLRHAPALLLGILALLMVDYIQLLVPQLYRLVINGVNLGQVVVRGETMPFTKEVLFQHICLPMIWIVLFMVVVVSSRDFRPGWLRLSLQGQEISQMRSGTCFINYFSNICG